MFEDYKKEVILEYHKKRKAGTLSNPLMHPSPAQLKMECLKVYNERYSSQDDIILRSFFGLESTDTSFRQLMERTDPDRFRPLVNLLRDRIRDPRSSIIELLAWLIDFNPRPYALWDKKDLEPEPVPPPTDKLAKFKTKKAMAFYGLFLVLGIGLSMVKSKECMYWTGDHYEPVYCNEKIEGAVVIALNEGRVDSLKKIMRPDTLTEYSVGKVWCDSKRKGANFYTAEGEDPEDANKRLLLMTQVVLDNQK